MKLSFDVVVRATGARVFDAERAPREVRISTDTRALNPGDIFLALRGERFDGHAYTAQAVAGGAAALVVDRESARVPGVTTLLVGETLAAYMALGAAARERFSGRVIAITGSTGKTTTKVLLAQLLENRYPTRVLAAPANENNEIGVAKLLLEASNEAHDVLVVEMGARKYGDVATLVTMARPHVGLLTNVGDAHLEIMGSRERLEETKWGLFSGGANAVLNLSDEASRRRAPSLAGPARWFFAGESAPERPAGALCAVLGRDRLLVADAGSEPATRAVDVRVPGAHNRANVAAAIAGALELGVALDAIVAAVPSLTLPAGRFERIALARGPQLVYDAYNASAAGTIAALDALADESAACRIAVLGGMAELGDEAVALHERVGAHAAGIVDWLLAGGELASALANGAEAAGLPRQRIVRYATNHDAAVWLREHARRDDLVLLKGSRRYQLEEIVEELRNS
ncbi:MAG TPA: UDP-N-acetylmuramoyl-tripeptide--D-alanyl-D-alanine ligase [Candidatus Dormibacteraeota bacterium]|nr:UDP-N-acetylmuramoyl-tripeptide--D-alanyl-D-alanine ligase [Candidatus Dormibacteraeota bacterium]